MFDRNAWITEAVMPIQDAVLGLVFETGRDGSPRPWGSYPVQASGVMPDGRAFYFRFRHNIACLTVFDGPPEGGEHYLGDDRVALTASSFEVYPGDDQAGMFVRHIDLVRTFLGLVAGLRTPDPETNPTYAMRLTSALAQIAP